MTESNPGPESRSPLRAALGQVLELALERLLALDPGTRDAIAALDGREIGLALQTPPLALRLRVQDGRLRVGPDTAERQPDLSLRTTLGAVLSQLLPGGATDALPVGQVHISGDAELARRVQQIVRRYEPDLEAALARVFGDVLGVQIARTLASGWRWTRESAARLARDGADYLTEERRDVVSKPELDTFLDEVDALRERAERIERRFQRLRARLDEA